MAYANDCYRKPFYLKQSDCSINSQAVGVYASWRSTIQAELTAHEMWGTYLNGETTIKKSRPRPVLSLRAPLGLC
jgi:hypothetical protein